MRIRDFANMATWEAGNLKRAGSGGAWHYQDGFTLDGNAAMRLVYHYGVLMASLVERDGVVSFQPHSVGCGTVSDQGGINDILRALGSVLRYRRDARGGGPRYSLPMFPDYVLPLD